MLRPAASGATGGAGKGLWLIYWLLIAVTIIGSGLPRLGHGTWVWRSGSSAAGVFGGVPMEWEWVDVAQSAWFAEGDPRWQGRLDPALKGQNALRFLPGLAVSWIGAWTGSAWRAAVLLTWLCWLSAAVAMYGLGTLLLSDRQRGRRVGAIAAALVALGPGFSAFFGNIDAHPFGYAAAPLALLALERARSCRGPLGRLGPDDRIGASWLLGGVLFLANATLELGPPLLAFMWLFYVVLHLDLARLRSRGSENALRTVWSAEGRLNAVRSGAERVDAGRRAGGWRERTRWAATVSAAYLTLQASWWAIANVAALGNVQGYNEGLPMLQDALSQGWPSLQAVTGMGILTVGGVINIFTVPVAMLFLPGLLVLPRRVALWALLWVALVIAASLVTRNFARVHYLAFPGMYLAAAAAAERAGALIAVPFRGALTPPLRLLLQWSLPALLIYTVGRIVLADLAGDLTMVRHWWQAS
ncbi:MAG: hypothetical protein M3442_02860 [Chloroflexota bacterium]|nr:hypothetical protein [Chloroflexota bacterium]